MYHKSVLLNESIEYLNIKENGIYIDATLGYAGHSSEILKRIPKGYLYAFDQDEYAILKSQEKLSTIFNNYTIIHDNFSNMEKSMKEHNVDKVDGILFDLGVSSVQIDEKDRGFSFHKNAKLDMRMDTSKSFSAYDVVNTYSKQDLTIILREYGEEKYASSIANNIVKSRNKKEIETTFELVDIIKSSMPASAMRDAHPARRTFQAIRIEVNHELDVLKEALDQALNLLKVGGRICVITFHSLEERQVIKKFKKVSELSTELKDLPFIPEEYLPKFKIIKKALTASKQELEDNYRSHSAKLFVIERISD